jgi:hypothetical protein
MVEDRLHAAGAGGEDRGVCMPEVGVKASLEAVSFAIPSLSVVL